jgi:hypothetical protein
MPDYNPDKEAWHSHKWIVHKANTDYTFNKVVADGREIPFNHEGRFVVKDESMANAIRKKYPRAVTVTRFNSDHVSDRGHKYFFAGIAMPWHEEEE